MLKLHRDSNKERLDFAQYYDEATANDTYLNKLINAYQDKLATEASKDSLVHSNNTDSDKVYVPLESAMDVLNRAVLTIYRMMQKSEELRKHK